MLCVAPARLLLAFALVVCVTLIVAAPAGAKRKAPCADAHVTPDATNLDAVGSAVLCLHNRARSARGLPTLKVHVQLRAAAEEHAVHMVEASFFSHDEPGGADMVARVLGTGYAKGAGWSLGENIAYGTGDAATAAEIHRSWMRSPGHRANILRRQFREVGIGVAVGAPVAAQDGVAATYTADFGVRR